MADGCFTVTPDNDRRDIVFRPKPDASTDIPEEQLALKDEVERALTVLRALFPAGGDSQFENYYRPLVSLAQLALAANPARPQIASRALVALKNEVVAREAGHIKNRYMKQLGALAAVFAIPTAAVGLSVRHWTHQIIAADFLVLWAGCMAGVWLSFGARKFTLAFEDLHIPEADRLEPSVRLVFAGLLTMILGLSFSVGLVSVRAGSVTTDAINNSLRLSALMGLLCGFSEQVLSTRVAKQATSFLDSIR